MENRSIFLKAGTLITSFFRDKEKITTKELYVNPCVGQKASSESSNGIVFNKTFINKNNGVSLKDIFQSLEELKKQLKRETKEFISQDIELIFKLINADKKDFRIHKRLTREIKSMALKKPKLAKAISDLRDKTMNYHDPINFSHLLSYGFYVERKTKRNF